MTHDSNPPTRFSSHSQPPTSTPLFLSDSRFVLWCPFVLSSSIMTCLNWPVESPSSAAGTVELSIQEGWRENFFLCQLLSLWDRRRSERKKKSLQFYRYFYRRNILGAAFLKNFFTSQNRVHCGSPRFCLLLSIIPLEMKIRHKNVHSKWEFMFFGIDSTVSVSGLKSFLHKAQRLKREFVFFWERFFFDEPQTFSTLYQTHDCILQNSLHSS